jgi:hypothetical protein
MLYNGYELGFHGYEWGFVMGFKWAFHKILLNVNRIYGIIQHGGPLLEDAGRSHGLITKNMCRKKIWKPLFSYFTWFSRIFAIIFLEKTFIFIILYV